MLCTTDSWWLFGPIIQLPILQTLVPNLTTMLTVTYQAAQLHSYWSINLDLLRLEYWCKLLFTLFFVFGAEPMTHYKVVLIYSASSTDYLIVSTNESITQWSNSSFRPELKRYLASSLDRSFQKFNFCKTSIVYPVMKPVSLHIYKA